MTHIEMMLVGALALVVVNDVAMFILVRLISRRADALSRRVDILFTRCDIETIHHVGCDERLIKHWKRMHQHHARLRALEGGCDG